MAQALPNYPGGILEGGGRNFFTPTTWEQPNIAFRSSRNSWFLSTPQGMFRGSLTRRDYENAFNGLQVATCEGGGSGYWFEGSVRKEYSTVKMTAQLSCPERGSGRGSLVMTVEAGEVDDEGSYEFSFSTAVISPVTNIYPPLANPNT